MLKGKAVEKGEEIKKKRGKLKEMGEFFQREIFEVSQVAMEWQTKGTKEGDFNLS